MAIAATEFFVKTCLALAALTQKHFRPKGVTKNGFAVKSFLGFAKAEDALQASLKVGDKYPQELGKNLGMVPAHKHLDCNFSSGSFDLHVLVQPVTFEKIATFRRTANFKASRYEKARVDRLNVFADRTGKISGHALMLEVDLMEFEPPQDALERHFKELQRLIGILRKQFVL